MRANARSPRQANQENTTTISSDWPGRTSVSVSGQPASSMSVSTIRAERADRLSDRSRYTASSPPGSPGEPKPGIAAAAAAAAAYENIARLRAESQHQSTPSDDLYYRNATYDSTVDNLPNSFDYRPQSPLTGPVLAGPFVPSYPVPHTSVPPTAPRAPQSRKASTAAETFFAADDDTHSLDQTPQDPYSLNTSAVQTKPSTPRRAPSKDAVTKAEVHEAGVVRAGASRTSDATPNSAATPRPQTAKHNKKKSTSSNKSVDKKDKTAQSSTTHTRTNSRGTSTADQVSKEVKATRRRSKTGPSAVNSSILDRARPIPAEYHDFTRDSQAPRASYDWRNGALHGDRPSTVHKASDALSSDDNFRPQISSNGKVAALTGNDAVLASSRDGIRPSTRPSRKPSTTRMDSSPALGSISGAGMVRSQPSTDLSRGKQGFFRRVFGSSRTNTPRPQTPPFQLPPIQTLEDFQTSPPGPMTEPSPKYPAEMATGSPAPALRDTTNVRESPHVVQKKSSFFRRRKKSVGGDLVQDPMPSPMTMAPVNIGDSTQAAISTAAQSPEGGGLRQAMDPFLASNRVHTTIGSSETFFFDSREQQSREGPSVAGDPGGQSKGGARTSQESARHRGAYSDLSSPHGAADVAKAPPAGKATWLAVTTRKGSTGLAGTTPTLRGRAMPSSFTTSGNESTIRRVTPSSIPPIETDAARGTSHMAASAAQLTGRIMPESPEDDWVANTPFRRDRIPTASTTAVSPAVGPVLSLLKNDETIRPNLQQALSASSVPTVYLDAESDARSPTSPIVADFDDLTDADDVALAKMLFEGHNDPMTQARAVVVLGQQKKEPLRRAYLGLFDFGGINILLALRDLCGRLTLKGETQQVDRVIAAFAERWCECNPSHGFKSKDVVHTICYSILLLNTDLHVANIDQKMTKPQFVRNTLSTITSVAEGEALSLTTSVGSNNLGASNTRLATSGRSTPLRDARSPSPHEARPSTDGRLAVRNSSVRPASGVGFLASPVPFEARPVELADLLISTPFDGATRGWEDRVGTVLKEFYTSIRAQRLPLHGASDLQNLDSNTLANNLSVHNPGTLRRAGSIVSKTGSEGYRRAPDARTAPNTWNVRSRSKPKMYHSSAFGSSTTSFEEGGGGSVLSPSASSTWSRSLGKPTTTMSTDSLASAFTNADYGIPVSAGFAGALSQAIIREEEGPAGEDESGIVPMLEDETLELEGAPWAKEGMLHHKHHLEGVDKKAKDRTWYPCFAVIEKGQLRLFSFSSKTAGRSQKNKTLKGGIVGGGNWMDNAEELASFTLRQTLANELPPPGYSSKRPHVFALMFPTGALHLFHVGTPEIAREFVSTANYWSARLSKEPLVGGVSNVEYGWSENIINGALLSHAEASGGGGGRPPSAAAVHSPSPSTTASTRQSIQGSLRGASFDAGAGGGVGRAGRTPGDRVPLSEWHPPQQSLARSDLREAQQLESLRRYVRDVEDDLRQHNELRAALTLVYTPRQGNAVRAMQNWERKSSYLLREIVKFRTYIDSLEGARAARDRVLRARADRQRPGSAAA